MLTRGPPVSRVPRQDREPYHLPDFLPCLRDLALSVVGFHVNPSFCAQRLTCDVWSETHPRWVSGVGSLCESPAVHSPVAWACGLLPFSVMVSPVEFGGTLTHSLGCAGLVPPRSSHDLCQHGLVPADPWGVLTRKDEL